MPQARHSYGHRGGIDPENSNNTPADRECSSLKGLPKPFSLLRNSGAKGETYPLEGLMCSRESWHAMSRKKTRVTGEGIPFITGEILIIPFF